MTSKIYFGSETLHLKIEARSVTFWKTPSNREDRSHRSYLNACIIFDIMLIFLLLRLNATA